MAELYNESLASRKSSGTLGRMDELPIAEARANLSDVASQVRYTRQPVRLTRRGTPQAAIVPVDLGDLIEAVGGVDKAAEILRQAMA